MWIGFLELEGSLESVLLRFFYCIGEENEVKEKLKVVGFSISVRFLDEFFFYFLNI